MGVLKHELARLLRKMVEHALMKELRKVLEEPPEMFGEEKEIFLVEPQEHLEPVSGELLELLKDVYVNTVALAKAAGDALIHEVVQGDEEFETLLTFLEQRASEIENAIRSNFELGEVEHLRGTGTLLDFLAQLHPQIAKWLGEFEPYVRGKKSVSEDVRFVLERSIVPALHSLHRLVTRLIRRFGRSLQAVQVSLERE